MWEGSARLLLLPVLWICRLCIYEFKQSWTENIREKNCIRTKYVQTFFSSLFSKLYSVTAVYIVLGTIEIQIWLKLYTRMCIVICKHYIIYIYKGLELYRSCYLCVSVHVRGGCPRTIALQILRDNYTHLHQVLMFPRLIFLLIKCRGSVISEVLPAQTL